MAPVSSKATAPGKSVALAGAAALVAKQVYGTAFVPQATLRDSAASAQVAKRAAVSRGAAAPVGSPVSTQTEQGVNSAAAAAGASGLAVGLLGLAKVEGRSRRRRCGRGPSSAAAFQSAGVVCLHAPAVAPMTTSSKLAGATASERRGRLTVGQFAHVAHRYASLLRRKAAADAEQAAEEGVSSKSERPEELIAQLALAAVAVVLAAEPARAEEAIEAAQNMADAAQGIPQNPMGDDWFTPVAQLNAGVLQGLDDLLTDTLKIPNSFGYAIIIFTAVIKLITYPLNASALRASALMQLIQPKVKQINERYKNDSETMNRMMLRLYDDCGVNPLGGCLPSLIQLPIFLSLYRALSALAQDSPKFQEPFLFIPSLAGPAVPGQPGMDWLLKSKFEDHFEPMIGWDDAPKYIVLPITIVITTYFTTKLSSPATAQSGGPAGAVTALIPLLIGYSTLVSPSGLGIYWLSNNVFTALQTFIIRQGLKSEFPEYAKMLDGQQQMANVVERENAIPQEERPAMRGFGGGDRFEAARPAKVEKENEEEEEEEELEEVAPRKPKVRIIPETRAERAKRIAKKTRAGRKRR